MWEGACFVYASAIYLQWNSVQRRFIAAATTKNLLLHRLPAVVIVIHWSGNLYGQYEPCGLNGRYPGGHQGRLLLNRRLTHRAAVLVPQPFQQAPSTSRLKGGCTIMSIIVKDRVNNYKTQWTDPQLSITIIYNSTWSILIQ